MKLERWYTLPLGGQFPDAGIDVRGVTVDADGLECDHPVCRVDVGHRTHEARTEAERKARQIARAPEVERALRILLDVLPEPKDRQGAESDAIRHATAVLNGIASANDPHDFHRVAYDLRTQSGGGQ